MKVLLSALEVLADVDGGSSTTPIDGGIPLTLGISCLIFFVGFMAMQYLRPRMYYLYYPRIWSKGDDRPFWLSFENCAWILRAARAGRDEVAIRTGMQGLLYIRFSVFMLLYVIIMAALALPILLTLNLVAGEHPGAGFIETTATNIPDGSSYLAAHTVLTIVFVVIGLLMISWFQRMYFHTRKVFRSRDFVNSHTLKIGNIPKDVVEAELMAFFEMLYPGEVSAVHMAIQDQELVGLKMEKQNYLKQLANAEYRFSRTGDRPMVNPGTLGWFAVRLGLRAPEDAMAYYKAALVDISAKISRRQKFEQKSAGVAFVTFSSSLRAHAAHRDFYLRKERKAVLNAVEDQELRQRLKPDRWSVVAAERPQHIYWNHLAYSTTSKVIRRIIVFFGVLISSFLWSLPIAFLASVEILEEIPGLGTVVAAVIRFNPFFRDIIEGYIPSLLTTILVMCLPGILVFVVQWEKPDTKAARFASVLRLYYMFILLNVLVFPTFVIGTLDGIASGYEESAEDVVRNINFSLQGAFYINYIIQQTFFSGIIRLTRPHHVGQYWFGYYVMAVTDEDREQVRKAAAHEMLYRIRYAQLLVVMACCCTFAVVVPLVLVAGFIFVVLMLLIDKNNILHCFPKVITGDGSMMISVINMFLIALLIYETLTALFFWFKESVWSFSVVIVLMALTLTVAFTLTFLNWYNRYRYIKYGKPLLVEWNLPPDLLQNAYQHPGLVEEEGDLDSRLDNFISGGGNISGLRRNKLEEANEEYERAEQETVLEGAEPMDTANESLMKPCSPCNRKRKSVGTRWSSRLVRMPKFPLL